MVQNTPKSIAAELEEIVTPVNAQHLNDWLTGYDTETRGHLHTGFTKGFQINCRAAAGTLQQEGGLRNHRSASDKPDIVGKMIQEEVESGRIAGPFLVKPLQNLVISPLSLRPKKTPNKYRLIHDLSYPAGSSVNDYIWKVDATVQYENLDRAISIIHKLGPGCFLAKTDIKGAFRIIPVHPGDRQLLGIHWNGGYYFDKCLVMGCRTACRIFETFSTALAWICQQKLGVHNIAHVLDDFLFLESTETACQGSLDSFMKLCEDINIPLAPEKTQGPAQVLTFLGIELDTVRMQAKLPQDKLSKCRENIQQLLPKRVKHIRLRRLQSIIGLLNFACRVIAPGRAFLRRLIDLTQQGNRPHHFIKLTRETKEDLRTWLAFLKLHNGVTIFPEAAWTEDHVLNLYTDAASQHGFGGVLGRSWFLGEWPDSWKTQNIALLELYPIVVAMHIWGHVLTSKRVLLHTDNQALVPIINKRTCKDTQIMKLVRSLMLATMRSHIIIKAVHVPGRSNGLADALSRLQVDRFHSLAPSAEQWPVKIPVNLLPQALVEI